MGKITLSLLPVAICQYFHVLIRWVTLVEQELPTIQEHMSSVFSRVRVAQYVVFCVVFCKSLYISLSLYFLLFFWLLIIFLLVSFWFRSLYVHYNLELYSFHSKQYATKYTLPDVYSTEKSVVLFMTYIIILLQTIPLVWPSVVPVVPVVLLSTYRLQCDQASLVPVFFLRDYHPQFDHQ